MLPCHSSPLGFLERRRSRNHPVPEPQLTKMDLILFHAPNRGGGAYLSEGTGGGGGGGGVFTTPFKHDINVGGNYRGDPKVQVSRPTFLPWPLRPGLQTPALLVTKYSILFKYSREPPGPDDTYLW